VKMRIGIRESGSLAIAKWSEQKPRERQVGSRMARALTAYDKEVETYKEEHTMKPSTKDKDDAQCFRSNSKHWRFSPETVEGRDIHITVAIIFAERTSA
jgi:hypothetical protein